MTVKEVYLNHKIWFYKEWQYKFEYWTDFDYSILDRIVFYHRAGKGTHESWNECFIMLDTETSKKDDKTIDENHICSWSISIRAFDQNICTLWGHKPSECVKCIDMINENLRGDNTAIYVHNLSYDWWFLRQYMLNAWGTPNKQLNVSSLRPINIEFMNGIVLKDSLILAQRSLDKWGSDLNVEHKKAVGSWGDYDQIRHQDYVFNDDELKYMEHDTLCGVECLDATAKMLNKKVYSMPYTATGIPREELRNISKKSHGRDWFKKQVLTYEQQQLAEDCYHGGFTHNNRHIKNALIDMVYTDDQTIKCKDFASSYPYAMFQKLPGEQFNKWWKETDTVENILSLSDRVAFMFTLALRKVRLKDSDHPMPYLQFSKCKYTLNVVNDNGRILKADAVIININSVDLEILNNQYEWDFAECSDILFASLDYLPKWFLNYIWKCYTDKTMLKGGDPVLYSIAKAKLNALYGMCAQHPVKPDIIEDYENAEYKIADKDMEEAYERYTKSRSSFLPYQIGVFVTSIAAKRLFELSECISDSGQWLYTDTDSIYAFGWDESKVNAYNQKAKDHMISLGYGCITHNDRQYWLGVAEDDGEYQEFIGIHSKCYAKRDLNGKLSITVAGVPKKGVNVLNDDITNFKAGLIFPGQITGKKQHTYFHKEMYIDKWGNETADSIDLSPCAYLLNDVVNIDIKDIMTEEISMQVYDNEE